MTKKLQSKLSVAWSCWLSCSVVVRLIHLLQKLSAKSDLKAIVFVDRKMKCDEVAGSLRSQGYHYLIALLQIAY